MRVAPIRCRSNVLQKTARRAATVLALILSLGTLGTIVAPIASAQTVASKTAEANRIASQLEKLADRASVLTEDYNEARVKAAEIDARARNAASDLDATNAKANAASESLKKMSVNAYMRGGLNRAAGLPSNGGDPARANFYLHSAANQQKDAIDGLRAAKLALAERQAGLDAARAQARRLLNAVSAKRSAAASAESAQRALLSKVKGDLTALVSAERARRSAAPAAATAAKSRPSRGRVNLGTPPGADAPAPNTQAGAAVAEAKKQLGKPYKWAGSGPESFDCSGLTSWAWRVGAGRSLPHSSRAQYSATSRVAMGDIAPGDLLFYGSSVGSIHHVGIYSGGGYMVDAPETGRNVQYVPAFRKDLVGIGRIN